jgi:hypothetical protein
MELNKAEKALIQRLRDPGNARFYITIEFKPGTGFEVNRVGEVAVEGISMVEDVCGIDSTFEGAWLKPESNTEVSTFPRKPSEIN